MPPRRAPPDPPPGRPATTRPSIEIAESPAGQIERFSAEADFVAALARGLAVMHAFSQKRRHLSIAQISHRTGISRASVRRSLHTLVRLGYIAVDETNHFYLRPKVLEFGDAYLSGTPIAVMAQPVLDRLSDRVQESCSLATRDGDEIVYLARSVSSRIYSASLNVGRRLPAYCMSIGQVLLSEMPPDEIEDYLARVPRHAYTEHTVTDTAALRNILAVVRTQGYAISDQQWERRIAAMAVPVRDTVGSAVGGINILLPSRRMSYEAMVERFLPPLQEAAEELGRFLLP